VIGYWRWRDGLPPVMGGRALAVSDALLAIVVLLASSTNNVGVLPAMVPVALALLVSHGVPGLKLPRSRLFFNTVVIGLVIAFILALKEVPVSSAMPLLISFLIIMLLN